MDTFLLFSILVLISIIVLLMLTLVDQMREVRNAVSPAEQAPSDETDGSVDDGAGAPASESIGAPDAAFGGISGKKLWDLMTGKPLPDLDPAKASELRPRYQVILNKHIEELFGEGAEHGRAGGSKPAANRRTITGLRGSVVSWIPQPQADAIYQSGFDSAKAGSEALQSVRSALADACNALYGRTGLENNGAETARKILPGGTDDVLASLSPEEAALLGEPSQVALPSPEKSKAVA